MAMNLKEDRSPLVELGVKRGGRAPVARSLMQEAFGISEKQERLDHLVQRVGKISKALTQGESREIFFSPSTPIAGMLERYHEASSSTKALSAVADYRPMCEATLGKLSRALGKALLGEAQQNSHAFESALKTLSLADIEVAKRAVAAADPSSASSSVAVALIEKARATNNIQTQSSSDLGSRGVATGSRSSSAQASTTGPMNAKGAGGGVPVLPVAPHGAGGAAIIPGIVNGPNAGAGRGGRFGGLGRIANGFWNHRWNPTNILREFAYLPKFERPSFIDVFKVAQFVATPAIGYGAFWAASKVTFAVVGAVNPVFAATVATGVGLFIGLKVGAKAYDTSMTLLRRILGNRIQAPLQLDVQSAKTPAGYMVRVRNATELIAKTMGLGYVVDLAESVIFLRKEIDSGLDVLRRFNDARAAGAKTSPNDLKRLQDQVDRYMQNVSKQVAPSEKRYAILLQRRDQMIQPVKDSLRVHNPSLLGRLEAAAVCGFTFDSPGRMERWRAFAARSSDFETKQVSEEFSKFLKTLSRPERQAWESAVQLDKKLLDPWTKSLHGAAVRTARFIDSLVDPVDYTDPSGPKPKPVPMPKDLADYFNGVLQVQFKNSSSPSGFSTQTLAPTVGGFDIRNTGQLRAWEEAANNDPLHAPLAQKLRDHIAELRVKEPSAAAAWDYLYSLDGRVSAAMGQWNARDSFIEEIKIDLRGRDERHPDIKISQFTPRHTISPLDFFKLGYEVPAKLLTVLFKGKRFSSTWNPLNRGFVETDLVEPLMSFIEVVRYIDEKEKVWATGSNFEKDQAMGQIEIQIKGLPIGERVAQYGDRKVILPAVQEQLLNRYHVVARAIEGIIDNSVRSQDPKVKAAFVAYTLGFPLFGQITPWIYGAVGAPTGAVLTAVAAKARKTWMQGDAQNKK